MSRTTQRARASFYGSSGKLRLGSIIAMLIVVGMLMNRAADPRNWVWLTGEPSADKPSADKQTTLAVAEVEKVAPDEPSSGPIDTDLDEREAVREQFQAITDHTTALGREEMPAYWRLFSWTEHQSLADLQRRADASAVLNQFIQAPDEQRGKLFQFDFNVRRVLSYDAPANSAGIEKVYEIWGWTTESKAWLYVVLTAHLPPGMPLGPDVNERASFAGYFLKTQGYHAAGAGPNDKTLVAPLLIGRLSWKSPPTVAANSNTSWVERSLIGIVLLGALGLAVWILIPRQARQNTRRVSHAAPLNRVDSPTSQRSEVRDWLADAERDSTNDQSPTSDFRFHSN